MALTSAFGDAKTVGPAAASQPLDWLSWNLLTDCSLGHILARGPKDERG
jgi:hypothetical protein